MPAPEAVVFDAYGTLLDVNGAMATHAARLGAVSYTHLTLPTNREV